MLTRPLVLKAKDRKPLALGPKVRVVLVHLSPTAPAPDLPGIINGSGLRDIDNDGLKEHSTDLSAMWLGTWSTNLALEFELPEAVPLAAISVWNFNSEWQTTNGIAKMDVSVSADGTNWQSVLRAAELAEAEGTSDYDSPTVLKLNGAVARKVRFENIVPLGQGTNVGLSEVVFHEAVTTRVSAVQPEDGATGVSLAKPAVEWVGGQGATEHRFYLGTNTQDLALSRTTRQDHLKLEDLQPNTAYFWRMDEVQPNGSVVAGRVLRFDTVENRPVAWWKFGESDGTVAKDASKNHLDGHLKGAAHWTPGKGLVDGALEFNGTDSFVDCGDSGEYNFSDGVTVSAWVKVRSFDKPWQTVVAKGDKVWRLQRFKEQGKICFSIAGLKPGPGVWMDTPSLNLVSKRRMDDSQWHHLVGTYDGQRATFYVDGALEDSAVVSGPLIQNGDKVMIGQNSGEPDRFFNGWIKDVRLYGHALGEDAIQGLYHEVQTVK